jgi:hypothetical protein
MVTRVLTADAHVRVMCDQQSQLQKKKAFRTTSTTCTCPKCLAMGEPLTQALGSATPLFSAHALRLVRTVGARAPACVHTAFEERGHHALCGPPSCGVWVVRSDGCHRRERCVYVMAEHRGSTGLCETDGGSTGVCGLGRMFMCCAVTCPSFLPVTAPPWYPEHVSACSAGNAHRVVPHTALGRSLLSWVP